MVTIRLVRYIKTNKKKGVTLIEVLVVVGMIMVLSSVTLMSSKKTKDYINTIDVATTENEILSFIDLSKMYCRSFCVDGSITIDVKNKAFIFREGMRIIYKYLLPTNFQLKDVITSNVKNKIYIDSYGFTTDACTITFFDRNKKTYDISITVGTAYAEIKQ